MENQNKDASTQMDVNALWPDQYALEKINMNSRQEINYPWPHLSYQNVTGDQCELNFTYLEYDDKKSQSAQSESCKVENDTTKEARKKRNAPFSSSTPDANKKKRETKKRTYHDIKESLAFNDPYDRSFFDPNCMTDPSDDYFRMRANQIYDPDQIGFEICHKAPEDPKDLEDINWDKAPGFLMSDDVKKDDEVIEEKRYKVYFTPNARNVPLRFFRKKSDEELPGVQDYTSQELRPLDWEGINKGWHWMPFGESKRRKN